MDLLIIGIGGALGSLVRYRLGKYISEKSSSSFPFGTFIINAMGAMLLGFVIGLNVSHIYTLLLVTGFLGAYTTFSTFMFEGHSLFLAKKKKQALFYIATTLLLGILCYALGFGMARLFMRM